MEIAIIQLMKGAIYNFKTKLNSLGMNNMYNVVRIKFHSKENKVPIKQLIQIRARITLYETKRKALSEMSNDLEEEIEDTNKKLQKLWSEFNQIYSKIKL